MFIALSKSERLGAQASCRVNNFSSDQLSIWGLPHRFSNDSGSALIVALEPDDQFVKLVVGSHSKA
jgi:hypothetical protein